MGCLALGAVAPIVALAVVWHTLAFVLGHHPALPIADGWAPWSSLRQVLDGQTTPVQVLIARHNEHRILVTRLLFLLDLLDGGRDRVSTAASLAFQALQAGIWLALLRRTDGAPTMRWLVGGTAVAMLFTLRQGDNFISGFQAQFTGVFALNVVIAFMLLPRMVGGAEVGVPSRQRFAIAMAGLLVLPFTMANGLLAGPACAATGFLLRTRAGRHCALLAMSASILSVTLDRALPSDGTRAMTFAFTPAVVLHALAYIGGSVTSGRVPWAIAAGTAGVVSSLSMVLTVLRKGVESRAEAVAIEAVLFTLMSATAVGRIGAGFGVEQALSGRYATGSAAFWAATLVFWCARLSGRRSVPGRGRGTTVLTLGSILLLVFVVRDQHSYDRVLAEQEAAAGRTMSAFRANVAPAASDQRARQQQAQPRAFKQGQQSAAPARRFVRVGWIHSHPRLVAGEAGQMMHFVDDQQRPEAPHLDEVQLRRGGDALVSRDVAGEAARRIGLVVGGAHLQIMAERRAPARIGEGLLGLQAQAVARHHPDDPLDRAGGDQGRGGDDG